MGPALISTGHNECASGANQQSLISRAACSWACPGMGSSACELGVEGDVCEQVRPRLKLWDRSGSPGSAPEVSLGKCSNLGLHMTHATHQGPGMAPIWQDITRQCGQRTDWAHSSRCVTQRHSASQCARQVAEAPGSSSSPLVEAQTLPLTD